MLKLENVRRIYKSTEIGVKGYFIEFNDGTKIHHTKKRTIPALLILIKYGEGTEADLANGSQKLPEIKRILEGKIPEGFIQDFYGDANKPYSELWNEEGFTFIDNLKGGRQSKSQKYILNIIDHEKLLSASKKAFRVAPKDYQKDLIRTKQNNRCNLCGSNLLTKNGINTNTFSKDRKREVFDHRYPVEKGGDSLLENFQALCFYCNKSKWQICNICKIEGCSTICVLHNPEISSIITPTGEDISDLLANRSLFND